jgi:hypothetical protein
VSEAGGTVRPLAPQGLVWLIGSVPWRLDGLRRGRWVGDVTTRKLPVVGFRARMGDVIGLAGPGRDT